MKIVLGSSSKNRAELFNRLGIAYTVSVPNYEEVIIENEDCSVQVERFAEGKALSIIDKYDGLKNCLVLGFDSMISVDGKSIGKAPNREAMIEMLLSFAGKQQEVITGVCIIGWVDGKPVKEVFSVASIAHFRADITREQLEKYAQFGDWSGKCGAWSVMGTGLFFIEKIEGSFQNIVGVPVMKIRTEIERMTNKSIFDVVEPAIF